MKQTEALDMIKKLQLAQQAMEAACERIDQLKAENKALKEALAQPEQITVCIGYWNQKTGAYYKPDQISAAHQKLIDDGILRRCYTTPPQRKPLAYVDLRRIANQCDLGANEVSARTQATVDNFARAIEAAHGIKE